LPGTERFDVRAGVVAAVAIVRACVAEAGRAPLACARGGGSGNTGSGCVVRPQLGATSGAPRAGDDPGVVPSRVGAALAAGDLNTALTEMDTLADASKAPLADWAAQATLRRDALSAANDLAQTLASN